MTRPAQPARRRLMQAAAATVAAGAAAALPRAAQAAELKGNIHHSICHWCFKNFGEKWDLETICRKAKRLGAKSIELVGPNTFPTLQKHGLTCAITGSHGFRKGPNHKKNWDFCRERIVKGLDAASEFGCPNVITFTGFADGIDPDEGAKNCVEFFKSVIGHAEKKNVNLTIEHLNSRDDSHPMKGHPGYQGDLIRRIKEFGEIIGHVHTAGNPGRNELDDTQEIQYGPVMKALLEIGYKGFVGHEFIPTRDPETSLREAIAACDV